MEQNFRFKKKFGQNFLKNKSIVENIVKKSNILANSLVIEVGPGNGMLTSYLVKEANYVIAYEIDETLKDILKDKFKDIKNIEFIFGDFLERNIIEDIKKYDIDNIYFISNVPYYITTPILFKLIESKIAFTKIVMMVQKELGDRISATEGSRDYNALSVILSYSYNIKKLMKVSRSEFIPKPNVDSVVIELSSKKDKLFLKDINKFNSLVRDSFKFKRKNLRNNLKKYNLEEISEVLKKYDKDLTSRAEQLSLEVFVDIANKIN